MKIVHVLNHYLPDQVAGTEIYVAAMSRELKKLENVEVKVLIPNYLNQENDIYHFEGTDVIKYAEPSIPDRALMAGSKPPEGIRNFIAVLKNEQPDIVHFHEIAGSNGITFFHVRDAKAAGFRTIMTFHIAKYTCRTGTLMYMNTTLCDGVIRKIRCSRCWLNDRNESYLKKEIIRAGFTIADKFNVDTRKWKNSLGTALAFPLIIAEKKKDLYELEKNTDAFVVLTEWYKNILTKNGVAASHIKLIKQGLPSAVPLKDKDTGIPGDKIRLIFIGRINHFKGIDILIRAMKSFPQEKIALDIYGSAPDPAYWEECKNMSADHKNIRWLGSLNPQEVLITIGNYDVLCIPSAVCEMGPFVLKEAFAAGVPVLASEVYGNAEQVNDQVNGWLFKFKDVNSLEEKLQRLIDNPSLINEAKKFIPAIPGFNQSAGEQLQLYNQIIRGN